MQRHPDLFYAVAFCSLFRAWARKASNLDPGDPTHADFPQSAHGSINLQVLFNDPNNPE